MRHAPHDHDWMPRIPAALAARILFAIAIACFAWVGWVFVDMAVVEAYQGRQLASALEAAVDDRDERVSAESAVAAPEWGPLEEGELVGRVEIDRLDISALVLHGSEAGTLRRAVGHIPGTARPGEPGNVGLAGHRDSFFRPLEGISEGDRVILTTPHGTFEYAVDSTMVVQPADVHVLDPPASGEMLTLVTCYPFYYVGPAPDRFIVHARRVDAGFTAASSGGNAPSSGATGS